MCIVMHCTQALLLACRWTRDNFAYGSTPFHSWLSIFEHPLVSCMSDLPIRIAEPSIGCLTHEQGPLGCGLLRCSGQATCVVSSDTYKACPSVGQQHRLAGLLCCPDIWRKSCRYAKPQIKLCLVVTVHAAEKVLITAGVELLGCHVAFAQDVAKRYKVSAGANTFLNVK